MVFIFQMCPTSFIRHRCWKDVHKGSTCASLLIAPHSCTCILGIECTEVDFRVRVRRTETRRHKMQKWGESVITHHPRLPTLFYVGGEGKGNKSGAVVGWTLLLLLLFGRLDVRQRTAAASCCYTWVLQHNWSSSWGFTSVLTILWYGLFNISFNQVVIDLNHSFSILEIIFIAKFFYVLFNFSEIKNRENTQTCYMNNLTGFLASFPI